MNLFICCTNLQVLIAKRIIENSDDDNLVVVLCLGNIEKGRYYYDQIKQKCIESYFVPVSIPGSYGKVIGLFNLIPICYSFSTRKFKRCYISSIDNDQVHFILSRIHFNELFTFDDGSANINKKSVYYKTPEHNRIRKTIRTVFGVRHNLLELKEQVKCHYTIYKDFDNIVNSLYYINLFGNQKVLPVSSFQNCISIYIGQPLYGINPDYTPEHVLKLIKNTTIDYYFPHPIEDVETISKDIIHSPLIFEDYIIKEILKNPTTCYKIYSFSSSILFNIHDLPNVELFYFYDVNLEVAFDNIYNMYDRMGIKRIEI